jgi:hypothetical protein
MCDGMPQCIIDIIHHAIGDGMHESLDA